ncbi:MAG: Ketose-bisphosphate aldolase, class-II [Candidatus Roizmanbacteria bacterium GW2011_GWA2_32_13]|uniref:Ketose-bisphosphate aldolase, class-II n=1 Tax=Candidatus Roizmanbacteria bacterium GW2011_GWA2_32_13 TaxID=1618475 RepID=A0A0F9Z0I5_9BACT|nr:MAG: Ketose-bisphosphate aldolase, class-II [Candidatus Roizmanbacteria bacterium GW2011_GWA2_32_13]
MFMQSLNYYLHKAKSECWAVPHFNASNLEMIKAIVESSQELNAPVMIGMSESEREFIGLNQAQSIIKCYKEKGAVIFLNADHSKSFDSCKNAIDAGFDSIHFDGSHLSLKENFEITKKVVLYAKNKNTDISIEGELGYIPTESSKIYNKEIKVDKNYFTKPEQVRAFIKNSKINRLASVVGSIHGIAINNPHLDIDLIKRINFEAGNVSLVLHGGSGVLPLDIKNAIKAGISNIHISTELRNIYKDSLYKSLDKDNLAPYKIMEPVIAKMKEFIKEKIKFFGANNKCK